MSYVVSITTLVFAQDTGETQIEVTATQPEVQSVLESDGAAIKQQSDGSFQIFARGTGTYDFNDPEDIQDATNEAILKAKAEIAKFMNEQLSTEQGFESASQKTSKKTTDGTNVTNVASKESVKTSTEVIKSSASELLRGVIVLKTVKSPSGANSGSVQVTVGVSSKTLKAARQIRNDMRNDGSITSKESTAIRTVPAKANKAEVFINDTDF